MEGTEDSNIESISGEEIFKEAIAPEPTPEVETSEAKAERERDEKGRFVAKAEPEPTQEARIDNPVEPPETTKEEKPDHRIPLAELMKERDERQAAQRERDELRNQMMYLQQQMQRAQEPPPQPIDMFADPEGYQHHVEQTMSERMRAMEGNFSLRLAHYKHGDTFQEAWADMMSRAQRGDQQMIQQVKNSPDPGETLVQLYKREQVLSKVGADPDAFINKKLDEALKDPAFLARALEAAKASAGAQPTVKNKIDLPPSLNKVAATNVDADNDASGSAIYSFATAKR